jgi:hypothetical protein
MKKKKKEANKEKIKKNKENGQTKKKIEERKREKKERSSKIQEYAEKYLLNTKIERNLRNSTWDRFRLENNNYQRKANKVSYHTFLRYPHSIP